MNRFKHSRQFWLCGLGASLLAAMAPSNAAAPTAAPQVLLAITNSESMDGTTAGAIMVGSGSLGSGASSLSTSSSPTNYVIPPGFTPPLNAGSGGSAPWTVSCGSNQCDNGPSRMNMTKAAIQQVLTSYGSTLNFGLYDYSTGGASLYTTWVYYMSPTSSGFTFTNTASSTTVNNPCYQYTSASSSVNSSCAQVAGQYGSGVLNGNAYMNIGATSDAPLINDVLYAGGQPADFLTFGTVSPANPYTAYTIGQYNNGSFSEGYSQTSYGGSWSTTPTNAGYVPFSPQVLYSQRGFGYGASQSATTGNTVVEMSTDPTSSSFTNALQPETNNKDTSEIKSSAGQSAIYALMNGAKSYLGSLTKASCQGQFVVMLTDGLPTLDKNGKAWPPLGTTTGNAYNLAATYNADGSFASSNSQAVTDAIAAITALNTAGIKTFVIGLGAGVTPANNPQAAALLTAMAIAGGTGTAYAANDSGSLSSAFLTIVDIIYRSSAIAAPVAPISVAGGSSSEYVLTSISSPGSGHVQAFAVAASGVAATTASWDAGDATHMSTTQRGTALKAANASGAIVALGSVDSAAFNLATGLSCVQDVATIVAYTLDPSYSGGPSGCSYLAGRQSGWPLGVFSTQDTGQFMGPPGSGLLTALYPSYAAYARGLASRTPSLLFTDSDGFLYSINGSTGLLQWGWTSRSILAKLQNYSTFASSGSTDGGFAVVDAMDSSGSWGAYIVGSLQSGAEHFSLALDSSGAPTSVVYDTTSTGTSAGDLAGGIGSTPLRQPTIVAYIGNTAYQVYVVTAGTTSTLYERDVTSTSTTAPLSAALPTGFKVSSIISLDPSSNLLWLGGTDGTVRSLTLSGAPSTDVGTITTIGTTVNPSSGTAQPVLYLGSLRFKGIPYVYAVNSSEITMFGIGSTGWVPLWATTPSQGYTYSGTAYVTSSAVTTMTTSSVVSDLPIQIGPALLVPVYVAGSACTIGNGFYDLFNLQDGTFPKTNLTVNNTPVTGDLSVGPGPAFTPRSTAITDGTAYIPGSAGESTTTSPGTGTTGPGPFPTAQNPIKSPGLTGSRAVNWEQY